MELTNIIKSLAVVVCVVLLGFVGVEGVPVKKQTVSDMDKTFIIHKRSAGTVQFTMNQDSHNAMNNENNPTVQTTHVSKQAFNSDLLCPSNVFTGMDDPMYKRSSCPWYYEETRDSKRFPAVFLTAKPLCTYAIGSNMVLECTPITQTITVLKQQEHLDENGNYVWLEDTETIVIGYTAAGRRMAQSQPTSTASNNLPPPDFAK